MCVISGGGLPLWIGGGWVCRAHPLIRQPRNSHLLYFSYL